MADRLNRWRWQAWRLLERGGPVGVAAVAVGAIALAAWAVAGVSLQARAGALASDNEALLRRASAGARAASAPLGTQQQLVAFEQAFPGSADLGASYSRLWNVARRHGVALRQAEFKLSEGGQDEFQRYTILLPVTADYASLRAFVADALADLPGLALEEMNVRRGDSKSLQLDARLNFVLFVRRGEVAWPN